MGKCSSAINLLALLLSGRSSIKKLALRRYPGSRIATRDNGVILFSLLAQSVRI